MHFLFLIIIENGIDTIGRPCAGPASSRRKNNKIMIYPTRQQEGTTIKREDHRSRKRKNN